MTLVSTEPLEVTFQLLHPREDETRSGRAVKLSFSGTVVETDRLPPVGAILQLAIPIAARQIRMFAEVKWHNPVSPGRSFGAFFLMPTTGRMLDLIEFQIGNASEPGKR